VPIKYIGIKLVIIVLKLRVPVEDLNREELGIRHIIPVRHGLLLCNEDAKELHNKLTPRAMMVALSYLDYGGACISWLSRSLRDFPIFPRTEQRRDGNIEQSK
jgi:hypothetical protein